MFSLTVQRVLGIDIKLSRPSQNHVASVHLHHITQCQVRICFTDWKLDTTSLNYLRLSNPFDPTDLIWWKVLLKFQTQLHNNRLRENILPTSVVDSNITHLPIDRTTSAKEQRYYAFEDAPLVSSLIRDAGWLRNDRATLLRLRQLPPRKLMKPRSRLITLKTLI